MNILLLDTETTGLIKNSVQRLDKQPHVIEFYGCLIDDNGTKLEEVEFLCNPGVGISEEVTKITGLKNSDVNELLTFQHFIGKVSAILKKADVAVAHNMGYDFAVLNFEAERARESLQWPPIRLCTIEATEHLKGYRLSLTALHELLFGEPFEGRHRAKEDVAALTRCYMELKKKGEL
jgi:DNA polymerase-3 subunit alpha